MKRSSFFVGILGVTFAATAAFVGCASFQADICAYGVCKEGDGSVVGDGDASSEGGLPDSNAPGCSNTEDPASDPAKCFTDELAVFVSAEAQPGGTGTKLRPFRTIGEAIGTTKSRIVVCEGTYTERLTIGRPVEIFSRVNCAFTATGGRAQLFAPEGQETAVFVSQVSELKIVDMEISGPRRGNPNSIAMIVNSSRKVGIIRSLLNGGGGADAIS